MIEADGASISSSKVSVRLGTMLLHEDANQKCRHPINSYHTARILHLSPGWHTQCSRVSVCVCVCALVCVSVC